MLITESLLRTRLAKGEGGELCLTRKDTLTPAAWDYAREHGVKVIQEGIDSTQSLESGYIDSSGKTYKKKPEHMTHLRGNYLVPKTHPRIVLRGKIDSLQANILEVQILAQKHNSESTLSHLEEILGYLRNLLACEVKEQEFEWATLIGMDEPALREASHNPEKSCDIKPGPPSYQMGELAVALNTLRALARESELAAAQAFIGEDGRAERNDLLLALNRLSSAFHILYCRQAAKVKGGRIA